jgi:hypothetical protein
MSDFKGLALKAHWVKIAVYKRQGGDLVELLRWDDLRSETRTKWSWYFKYRAALLQVKYPKYYVDFAWGSVDAEGKTLEQIEWNILVARKRKISTYKNKLYSKVQEWDSMFPIEEDIPYQNTVAKIQELEYELASKIQLHNQKHNVNRQ